MKRASFEEMAQAYWTDERQFQQIGDKELLVPPDRAAWLWRQLGIMNPDARISHQGMRKLLQVNHLLRTLEPRLKRMLQDPVDIVDLCCGKSYLSIALAWLIEVEWKAKCRVLAIDSNSELCASVRSIVDRLELGTSFRTKAQRIDPVDLRPLFEELFKSPAQFSLALALHACDTATDDALASIAASRIPTWAVAPCCQAELAHLWSLRKTDHPLDIVFTTPQLRRDIAAEFTDAQRVLLMQKQGYDVVTIEFTAAEHTPKNRLLMGEKTQRRLGEFSRFVDYCGGDHIKLARLLGECASSS